MQEYVPKLITLTFIVLVFAYAIQFLKRRYFNYQCGKCGRIFNPRAWGSIFSLQLMGIRYIKCPKCNKRSWVKLVLKESKK
jgi:hypothetical protein